MYSNFLEIAPGTLPVGLYDLTIGLQWLDENKNPTNISFFKEIDQKVHVNKSS